jgi:hypothetical protein
MGVGGWDGDVFTDSNLGNAAGIQFPLQGVLVQTGPVTFAAETTITLTVIAAANAGGTGAITVTVFYVVP